MLTYTHSVGTGQQHGAKAWRKSTAELLWGKDTGREYRPNAIAQGQGAKAGDNGTGQDNGVMAHSKDLGEG